MTQLSASAPIPAAAQPSLTDAAHGVLAPQSYAPTGKTTATTIGTVPAVFAFSLFASGLIRGTALFSQMANPSQPDPYGPNPFEVQQ